MPATQIKRALLSVHAKDGLVDFARALDGLGIELLSSGGTAATLHNAGLPVVEVSEVTGFPEIMDGRVKTLHPMIHGGILARRDHSGDRRTLEQLGIPAIDLVCVNLYPFEQVTSRPDCPFEVAIENIDVGGPAMIRAAAKNHQFVYVVTRPHQYANVLRSLRERGCWLDTVLSEELAREAFATVIRYDQTVYRYLTTRTGPSWPRRLFLEFRCGEVLRYGENPHQAGAVYWEVPSGRPLVPPAPGVGSMGPTVAPAAGAPNPAAAGASATAASAPAGAAGLPLPVETAPSRSRLRPLAGPSGELSLDKINAALAGVAADGASSTSSPSTAAATPPNSSRSVEMAAPSRSLAGQTGSGKFVLPPKPAEPNPVPAVTPTPPAPKRWTRSATGLSRAVQVAGKELSFNNLYDADSAWSLVQEFDGAAAVVIKHANPCGAAIAETLGTAFLRAYDGDAQAAFGGIVAFNRPVLEDVAEVLIRPGRFLEVIVAPDFASKAVRRIVEGAAWGKSVRLLTVPPETAGSTPGSVASGVAFNASASGEFRIIGPRREGSGVHSVPASGVYAAFGEPTSEPSKSGINPATSASGIAPAVSSSASGITPAVSTSAASSSGIMAAQTTSGVPLAQTPSSSGRTPSLSALLAANAPPLDYKRIAGGLLIQVADVEADEPIQWKIVTRRTPTAREYDDLRFAWTVVKHVKSNAVVLAREQMLIGVGAGQMKRLDSSGVAVKIAGGRTHGAVVASDAFFPFRDGLDEVARAGVTAVIQPGGSKRDEEVIAAADEHNIAMIFTGRRHFRH